MIICRCLSVFQNNVGGVGLAADTGRQTSTDTGEDGCCAVAISSAHFNTESTYDLLVLPGESIPVATEDDYGHWRCSRGAGNGFGTARVTIENQSCVHSESVPRLQHERRRRALKIVEE